MEIIKRLSAVMEAVGNVSKGERNQAQGFNFRGIDAVVNAVSPALRKNGVVVVPRLIHSEYATVTVGKNQTQMGHARVQVEYAFYAEDGSSISAIVAAESMDSGDKATAKAMSVAFRTALLQALCLPTDELDPDHEVFERSAPVQKIHSTKPSPVAPKEEKQVKQVKQEVKTQPAGKPALSKAHQSWIVKTIEDKFKGEDPMVVAGDIIGRTIASLNEVTQDESAVLIPALAGGGK
jgi:hypothetical protein